jgi:indoleacetamide hydrolase
VSELKDRDRRQFILHATAALAVAANPLKVLARSETDMCALSASDAVSRMSQGDITVESYTQALLDRCEKLKSLNAFITIEPAKVLAAARACDKRRRAGRTLGPLFGLPIPIKDSVNTSQYPTTGGTAALRHFIPSRDAPIVSQLRDKGAIVLGKTNLHELSLGWTSNNITYGAVHNPYDPTRIAGGSSGGTAVAVSAGMAPLGLAEDTRGSIRVPAALSGVLGFRPTTGRYRTEGVIPLSAAFDQVGPIARTVSDLILFDSVLVGEPPAGRRQSLKGVRLGVVRDYWFADLDPEVTRITELAFRRLQDDGAEIVETTLPKLNELVDRTIGPMIAYDMKPALTRYLRRNAPGVRFDSVINQASKEVQDDYADLPVDDPDYVSHGKYLAARDMYLPALRRAYVDYFARSGVSAIVYPTTMITAPKIGEEDDIDIGGKKVHLDDLLSRNISPSCSSGIPGLVLPAGLTNGGLPVSLEFDSPARSDRELLALGLSLERSLGQITPPDVARRLG